MNEETKIWAYDKSNNWYLTNISSIDIANCKFEYADTLDLIKVNDLANLKYLNIPNILNCLHTRFQNKICYTYCSNILIAINPYHEYIDLYNNKYLHKYYEAFDMLCSYMNTNINTEYSTTVYSIPHIYTIALKSLVNIINKNQNQSVLISGDSGSGKTESAKYFMKLISYISERQNSRKDIESKLLSTNLILETFGNAKTVFNNNSSRFGKFVNLSISKKKKCVLNANIETTLLESTRVCYQQKNESNFHIFYKLLGYCTNKRNGELKLNNNLNELIQLPLNLEDMDIIFKSNYIINYNRIYDEHDELSSQYIQLIKIFDDICPSQKFLVSLFRVIIAVLLLGSIRYDGNNLNDELVINDETNNLIKNISILLEVEYNLLFECLTIKIYKTNNETIKKTVQQSVGILLRNTIAKFLYNTVFNTVVAYINDSLNIRYVETLDEKYSKQDSENNSDIGECCILDIFGFENFEQNSLEQLCINYTNEKLQVYFNYKVIEIEKELLISEGYNKEQLSSLNSTNCLEIFENKLSLFALLDEECKLIGGNDSNYAQKILRIFNNNKYSLFKNNKKILDEKEFIIKHYAGDVKYSCVGFVEKNNNIVDASIIECLKTSQNKHIVKEIQRKTDDSLNDIGDKMINNNKYCLTSVCSNFKMQLNNLFNKISQTESQFIKCFSSNSEARKNTFNMKYVANQMKSNGIVNSLKIYKVGFPVRISKDAFMDEFPVLYKYNLYDKCNIDSSTVCSSLDLNLYDQNNNNTVIHIINKYLTADLVFLGKTKIFLTNKGYNLLIACEAKIKHQFSCIIQKYYKQYIVKKKYKFTLHSIKKIQKIYRSYIERNIYRRKIYYAIKIQAHLRRCYYKDLFNKRIIAQKVIIRYLRRFLLKYYVVLYINAIIKIQNWAKICLAKIHMNKKNNASKLIVRWVKRLIIIKNIQKLANNYESNNTIENSKVIINDLTYTRNKFKNFLICFKNTTREGKTDLESEYSYNLITKKFDTTEQKYSINSNSNLSSQFHANEQKKIDDQIKEKKKTLSTNSVVDKKYKELESFHNNIDQLCLLQNITSKTIIQSINCINYIKSILKTVLMCELNYIVAGLENGKTILITDTLANTIKNRPIIVSNLNNNTILLHQLLEYDLDILIIINDNDKEWVETLITKQIFFQKKNIKFCYESDTQSVLEFIMFITCEDKIDNHKYFSKMFGTSLYRFYNNSIRSISSAMNSYLGLQSKEYRNKKHITINNFLFNRNKFRILSYNDIINTVNHEYNIDVAKGQDFLPTDIFAENMNLLGTGYLPKYKIKARILKKIAYHEEIIRFIYINPSIFLTIADNGTLRFYMFGSILRLNEKTIKFEFKAKLNLINQNTFKTKITAVDNIIIIQDKHNEFNETSIDMNCLTPLSSASSTISSNESLVNELLLESKCYTNTVNRKRSKYKLVNFVNKLYTDNTYKTREKKLFLLLKQLITYGISLKIYIGTSNGIIYCVTNTVDNFQVDLCYLTNTFITFIKVVKYNNEDMIVVGTQSGEVHILNSDMEPINTYNLEATIAHITFIMELDLLIITNKDFKFGQFVNVLRLAKENNMLTLTCIQKIELDSNPHSVVGSYFIGKLWISVVTDKHKHLYCCNVSNNNCLSSFMQLFSTYNDSCYDVSIIKTDKYCSFIYLGKYVKKLSSLTIDCKGSLLGSDLDLFMVAMHTNIDITNRMISSIGYYDNKKTTLCFQLIQKC